MPKLDADIYARGEAFADDERQGEALKYFRAAWDLLPEPKMEWAATWVLAAIGDMNFQLEDFGAARGNFSMAMLCPDAIGNPFLHLRLGQCQFEEGDMDRAADNLARAWLLGESELFEDDDPKYLEFIMGLLEPPPGGW